MTFHPRSVICTSLARPSSGPDGSRQIVELFHILRLKDGSVTDHWNVVDQLGLMRQLGVIPDQQPAAK